MNKAPFKLRSSFLFFALSLIPSNILRYPALGITAIALAVYSIYRNPPSSRLSRVNDVVTIVDRTLTQAKANCMRDHLLLAECETRILRTKLSASKIHTDLLEMGAMSWKRYLQTRLAISHNLALCEREVRDIQTSLLLLIEMAHQRKLAEDINLNQGFIHRP